MVNRILITISILICLIPAFAGNKLGDQFTLDSNNNSLGYRSPYVITKNQAVLFDADIEADIIESVIDDLNDQLVDISLIDSYSNVDYQQATEIFSIDPFYDLRYSPNRLFVFLGSGWSSEFFASLRVYENGSPTCFIGLRKSLWTQADNNLKKDILIHELFHCLGWAHPSNNPYTDNFDFISNDNVEVLDRLYDKSNTKDRVTVNLIKGSGDVVGFIGPLSTREERSTYTIDDQVKLIKGTYKIQVNDKYIRKITKNDVVKYTSKLKKAKKFKKKFSGSSEISFKVINQEE